MYITYYHMYMFNYLVYCRCLTPPHIPFLSIDHHLLRLKQDPDGVTVRNLERSSPCKKNRSASQVTSASEIGRCLFD